MGVFRVVVDFEFDFLVFFKGVEVCFLDFCVVDKYICGIVFGGDKVEFFFCVELFYSFLWYFLIFFFFWVWCIVFWCFGLVVVVIFC